MIHLLFNLKINTSHKIPTQLLSPIPTTGRMSSNDYATYGRIMMKVENTEISGALKGLQDNVLNKRIIFCYKIETFLVSFCWIRMN